MLTGFLVCTGCGSGEGAELCLDGPHPAASAAQHPADLAWISTLFALWVGWGGIHQRLKMRPSRLFTM